MILLIVFYLLPIVALAVMFWILLSGDIRGQTHVRFFRIFLLSLIAWSSLLCAADLINNNDSLLFLKLALFIGSFAPVVFFVFCQLFAGYLNKLITGLFLATSSLFAFFSLINFLVVSITTGELGIKIVEATPFYFLQIIYTILVFAFSFLLLIIRAKETKDPKISYQVKFITYGALLALFIGIVGGTINTKGGNLLSPLAITVFAGSSFFAIFRYGMFDINLIVARSIAYLLALGLITIIFLFLIFGLFSGVLLESRFGRPLQGAFYVVLTVTLVLAYSPLKKFFDRLTNKLFYRDAYDPQTLLDELNAILVGNIELKNLLEKSAKTIATNIKAEYCLIGIKETEEMPMRIFGTVKKTFSEEQIKQVKRITNSFGKQKVILADDLEEKHKKLRDILQENSIAILAHLPVHNGGTGYIILGYKKSGNPYSKLDVRMLDIIADELVIAIQNALRFEEIQQFNITLQQKIEEATKELKRVNARLRELDKTKDEFISMASHQLRTPLTTVKGYLSMVLEGDVGPVSKTEKEYIKKALDGANRMVYLIADMLNVSRLQTGKFVIENKPTDLAKIVDDEIAQLQETAAAKKLKLIYHKPAHFPLLNLDETKIRQVVMNFLDNAIHYTPPGGSVTAELTCSDKEVQFSVTDTGIGIPASVQHRLFSKFYRADNARKMRPDGTGLGLFMAKKVVAAQGGAIIFSSKEGEGSTFGFSFPRHAVEVTGKSSSLKTIFTT